MSFDQKNKKYWKLGMFYFNSEDPSKLVPKRTGMGMTINFAHAIPLFVLLIGLIALTGFIILAMLVYLILQFI